MKKRVDALYIKSGPTTSGIPSNGGPMKRIVGGEIFPIDKLSVVLSQYWLLIIILLIPFGFLLYKKRKVIPKLLSKMLLSHKL